MSITSIKLYPKQLVDYLVVTEEELDESIFSTPGSGILVPSFNPTWDSTYFKQPRIILQFEKNAHSSSVGNVDLSQIIGYKIYRKEIQFDSSGAKKIVDYTLVNQTHSITGFVPEIKDYLVKNNTYYQWVIVPVTEFETQGVSSETEQIKIDCETWSVIFLQDYNFYQQYKSWTPTDIFIFRCNLQPGILTQNMDKTQFDNFTQYPKFSVGSKNYLSGELTCLLSDVGYRENETPEEKKFRDEQGYNYVYYDEPAYKFQKWNECVASGRQCLIKDSKGHAFIGQIINNTGSSYGNNLKDAPTTISFSFIETDTIKNRSVFEEEVH